MRAKKEQRDAVRVSGSPAKEAEVLQYGADLPMRTRMARSCGIQAYLGGGGSVLEARCENVEGYVTHLSTTCT